MVTMFEYKQKIIPKVLVLFITVFFPSIINRSELYSSVSFYLILVFSQVIIYVYYSSKRLIITETGIEEKILWNLMWNSVKWEEMEEASVISHNIDSTKSSLQAMMEQYSIIKWFAENSVGTIIKIIITNREPLYLDLQEIKNSTELYKIIKGFLFLRVGKIEKSEKSTHDVG